MAAYDITALSSPLEYNTTDGSGASITYLTSTRFLLVYHQSGTLKVQCYDINRGTGVISAVGTNSFPGYSITGMPSVTAVSSTRALVFFADTSDAYVSVVIIDGSGNTSEGGQTAFSTDNSLIYLDSVKLDATHVLYTYANGSVSLKARVATFNSGADTVSLAGSAFEVDADTTCAFPTLSLISTSKCLISYRGAASDGFARVLSIDGSYNVTGAAVAFEFYDSSTITDTNTVIIDATSSPILGASLYAASGGATTGRLLQGLKIDSSAYTITNFVTTVRNQLDAYTTAARMVRALFRIDATHVIAFYEFTGADGMAQTLSINTTSGATTSLSTNTFESTQAKDLTAIDMGSGLFVAAWAGSGNDGFMQAFQVTMPSTDYPITAAQGSYTLTGQAMLMHLGRKMTSAYGAFTYTGQAMLMHLGRKMTAAYGAFTYTGQAVLLLFGKILTAAYGSFTYTGYAAVLKSALNFVASVGSYTWTGFATSLHTGHAILAALGTYTLTGFDATITSVRRFVVDVGTYTYTGFAAGFRAAFRVVAAVGNYTYTGFTAVFSAGLKILAAYASFTYTGYTALFPRASKVVAATGIYTLTGGIVRFLRNGTSVVLINLTKIAAGLTNIVKPSSSTTTNSAKNNSSLTNESKT